MIYCIYQNIVKDLPEIAMNKVVLKKVTISWPKIFFFHRHDWKKKSTGREDCCMLYVVLSPPGEHRRRPRWLLILPQSTNRTAGFALISHTKTKQRGNFSVHINLTISQNFFVEDKWKRIGNNSSFSRI